MIAKGGRVDQRQTQRRRKKIMSSFSRVREALDRSNTTTNTAILTMRLARWKIFSGHTRQNVLTVLRGCGTACEGKIPVHKKGRFRGRK